MPTIERPVVGTEKLFTVELDDDGHVRLAAHHPVWPHMQLAHCLDAGEARELAAALVDTAADADRYATEHKEARP